MSVNVNLGRTVVALLGEQGEREQYITVKALSKDRDTARKVIRLLKEIAIYTGCIEIFMAAVATLTQIESVYAAKSLVRILCDCSESESAVDCFIGELKHIKVSVQ